MFFLLYKLLLCFRCITSVLSSDSQCVGFHNSGYLLCRYLESDFVLCCWSAAHCCYSFMIDICRLQGWLAQRKTPIFTPHPPLDIFRYCSRLVICVYLLNG